MADFTHEEIQSVIDFALEKPRKPKPPRHNECLMEYANKLDELNRKCELTAHAAEYFRKYCIEQGKDGSDHTQVMILVKMIGRGCGDCVYRHRMNAMALND